MRRESFVRSMAFGVSLLVAGRAAAVSPAAETAFQEGRRLLTAGQTAKACVKFGESFALDASSGTLINLALCHEKQEKLATAWAEYLEAVRLARDQDRPDRAEVANVKASLVEPRVPKLTPTTPHPVPGLRVEIDQRTFGDGAVDVAVPIDPGPHQLTASAPGYLPWTTSFEIKAGEARPLEIPALEPKPLISGQPTLTPGIPPREGPPVGAPPGILEAPQARDTAGRSTPTLGWILAGSGVLLLGTGTAFGIVSLVDYHDADNLCPSRQGCEGTAISKRDSAETAAWVADATLGVGAVAAVVGGYLLWRDHREAKRRSAVTLTGGVGWLGFAAAY
jgi:hypothetical protein